MFNDDREVFGLSVFTFGDVDSTFQTGSSRCVNPIFISGIRAWWNDAIGSEEDGTVETLKFLFLLPPGIAVISY